MACDSAQGDRLLVVDTLVSMVQLIEDLQAIHLTVLPNLYVEAATACLVSTAVG
jgi:hypothetical protein